MAKPRLTQHRVAREEARSQDIRKLRGDNQALKKQVSRLRKQLERAAIPEHEEATPAPAPAQHTVTISVGCDCTAPDIVVVKLPTGTMAGCKGCGARRKV